MWHWLQLQRLWLKSLNIDAPGVAPPGDKTSNLETRFGFDLGQLYQQPDDFFVIPLGLFMEFKPMPVGPFSTVSCRVEAHFSIPWETPPYVVTRELIVNMLMVVYGNVRGLVASATGACRGGPFWLPTISMDALFEDFCRIKDNSPLRGIEAMQRDFSELRRQRGIADGEDSPDPRPRKQRSKGEPRADRAAQKSSSESSPRRKRT